jgi:hypothetical protein
MMADPVSRVTSPRQRVIAASSSSPECSSKFLRVSPDRKDFTIRWHGEAPSELVKLIKKTNKSKSFAVTLETTDYSTGELVGEAKRLVETYGVNGEGVVTAASADNDSDGQTVYVDSSVATSSASNRTAVNEATLGIESSFPIQVDLEEEAQPTTGNRYNESPPHFGGSAIAHGNSDGSAALCSTAFRVSKPSGATGMLTAYHCGAVGQAWENDHFTVGGVGTYPFGTVTGGTSGHGGAVLAGSTYADTSTWAGAWNAAGYTTLYGYVTTATVGTEVCYSGSKAGYVCGSIIQNANYVYAFPITPVRSPAFDRQ